jgi:hypothetical protein
MIVGGVGEGAGVFVSDGVMLGVGDLDAVSVMRGVRVGVMVGVNVGVMEDVGVGGSNRVGVSNTSGGYS